MAGHMVEEEEEDDYLNMSFEDPAPSKIETSIQRAARLKREAALRGQVKSKAERKAEEQTAREEALATSIDSSNKGFKMMQKLGFTGGALGKPGDDAQKRTEPIHLSMKEDRGGIGMDSEKKRKFREEAEKIETNVKRTKAEEGEYRDRLVRERAAKKMEGQIIGAMSVAEKLDEEDETKEAGTSIDTSLDATPAERERVSLRRAQSKPLSQVNILWRASVRFRLEKERDRRMRYDLHQSLSRRPTYDDPDEDNEDKQAFGTVVEDLEEEDPVLEEFLAQEPEDRLAKLVDYLRERWHYCFWCKFRYPDASMEGCPGITEDDHD